MIRTIIESKIILESYLQNNNHVNKNNDLVREAITFLENAPINKDLLQETRLGKVVNEFRKRTNDPSLAKRAKELVKQWRKFLVVDDARSTPLAGGGQGSSPSAAQTKRTSQPVSSPLCSSASSSPCLPRSANGTKALPPHVNNLAKSRPPPPSSFSQTFKPVSPAVELSSKTSVVHPKPYSSSHPSNQIKNSPHSLFNGTLSNDQPKAKFNGNHSLHYQSSSPRISHFSSEGSSSSSFRNFKKGGPPPPPTPNKPSISSANVTASAACKQSSPALPEPLETTTRVGGGKRKLEAVSSPENKAKRAKLNCSSPNSPALQRHRPNGPSVPKPYDKLSKSCTPAGSSNHSQKPQQASGGATPAPAKVNKVKTTKEIIKDLCAKKSDTYTLSLVNRISSTAASSSTSSRKLASPHVPRVPRDSSVAAAAAGKMRTSPISGSPSSTPPLTEVPAKKSVDEEIADILAQLPPLDRDSIKLEEEEEVVEQPPHSDLDPEDLMCKRLPGINGNFDHLGEWRELYEVLESSVTEENTIKILPYVIID